MPRTSALVMGTLLRSKAASGMQVGIKSQKSGFSAIITQSRAVSQFISSCAVPDRIRSSA